jgi:hypothetical protein
MCILDTHECTLAPLLVIIFLIVFYNKQAICRENIRTMVVAQSNLSLVQEE